MNEAQSHVAEHYLAPLRQWLDRDDVIEFVINRPGECLIEDSSGQWQRFVDESLTFGRIDGIARAIANATQQTYGESSPILSATLPSGERVQFVSPPVARSGYLSVTIRKPGSRLMSMEEYEAQGAFDQMTPIGDKAHRRGNEATMADRRREAEAAITDDAKKLLGLLERGETGAFLKAAVATKQNIIVSGSTGSGKTTLMKSLISQAGKDERLLSIENVDELGLDKQFTNAVAMFYSAGGQGHAAVDQQTLIQSAMRMRPDRVFVAELIRGEEALSFMDAINSGHPGSITSLHAESARHAWGRLALLVKQSRTGSGLDYDVIKTLLLQTIQIIIQVNRLPSGRKITEIYYDPAATLLALES